MPILRSAVVIALLVSPVMADEVTPAVGEPTGVEPLVVSPQNGTPVIGARAEPHHAAPLPVDGEGDYGFAGTASHGSDASSEPAVPITPDRDLLAYDEEETLLEAEAALAADHGATETTVID